ncbi:hypothetical protein Pcinc_023715 [Petrolisthes cinctipes]|uniref:Uncharacterized protein n=1 Tax=Petrolisthes cinctipes TaxID=88211 RepID=A0AAE1FCU8_PETCI|nr:hypothetical protein Pcinc_023715 [Petrolisthes cinctipes]
MHDSIKIAQLKSRCQLTNCPAGLLLQSDLFLSITSYDEFKSRFIKYFSGTHKSGSLAPLYKLAENHKNHDQPLPVMEAIHQASNVKLELIKQFETSNWVDKNGKVDLLAIGNLFGYYTFMFLLHPSTAKQSLDRKLDFNPQDTLTEFASKFEDIPSLVTATTVSVGSAPVATSSQHHQSRNTSRSSSTHGQQRSQNRSSSAYAHYSRSQRSPSPAPYYCYYCKRASVNIMTKSCFDQIRSVRGRHLVILDPPDLQLCGIDGTVFPTLGKIPLNTYLMPDMPPITLTFYISDGINIPADALIGRPALNDHEIDLYPRCHGIVWREQFIPEVIKPKAHSNFRPVHTASSIPDQTTYVDALESDQYSVSPQNEQILQVQEISPDISVTHTVSIPDIPNETSHIQCSKLNKRRRSVGRPRSKRKLK